MALEAEVKAHSETSVMLEEAQRIGAEVLEMNTKLLEKVEALELSVEKKVQQLNALKQVKVEY